MDFASRTFLDNNPLIEDLLVFMVFRSNYGLLWISDETNLYHFGSSEEISSSIQKVFNVNIAPWEIEESYATIIWLEHNFKISEAVITDEVLEELEHLIQYRNE